MYVFFRRFENINTEALKCFQTLNYKRVPKIAVSWHNVATIKWEI